MSKKGMTSNPTKHCSSWNRVVLLALALTCLSSCVTPPEIPTWFDSIQRMPVRTVRVDGHRIAYLDAGSGPVVILVHGFGGALWQWEYQQAALAASHRVITLDLLGAGWSDKPDIQYTPDEIVEFFRGFMNAVGVQRASLVGNSMGAGVAVAMALSYPERVDRLVLVTGLPDRVAEKVTSPLIKRAIESRAPIWLAELGNWVAGRSLTRMVLREMVHDAGLLTPAVIERSYRNRKRAGLVRPLLAAARSLPLWEGSFAKRLGEIRHPTLIVWGAEDKVFPPQVGQEMHASIPGSSFALIPESGHIPQWERPSIVNPILLEFLPSPT